MTSSSPPSTARDIRTATFGKWLVLVCSIYGQSVAMGVPVSLSVMFLDWQETFMVTRARTAVVLSTCIGILFGGAVVPGIVMSRLGARCTLLLGSVFATTGLLLSMFATDINFLIITTGVIAGIGFCFLQLPVIPCVTMVFTRHKAAAISLCMTGVGVINVVVPLLIRYLSDLYGWRGAFAFVAGITLNSSVTGMIITSTLTDPQNGPGLLDVDINVDANEEQFDDVVDGCDDSDVAVTPHHGRQTISSAPPLKSGTTVLQPIGTEFESGFDDVKPGPAFIADSKQTNNEVVETRFLDVSKTTDTFYDNRICDEYSNNNRKHLQTLWARLQHSEWTFLTDLLCLLVLLQVCLSLAVLFSFSTMLMDFARTSGFDRSTGLLLIMCTFASSILGRLLVGFVDVFMSVHSVVMFVLFSVLGAAGLLLLSFITNRESVIFILSLIGVSLGGQATVYPQCVLDMKSVTAKTYPIAYGFSCSLEGVVDLLVPVAIGAAADATGSHTLMLVVMGCASLFSSLVLTYGYLYSKRTSQVPVVHGNRKGTTPTSSS